MALLPNRHPQQDFFILDISDVVPKDDTASMEHPFYSLATQPDRRHLEYRTGDNVFKIRPSAMGLPTIFDKDILIFCISQLIHRKNQGKAIGNKVRFSARELLVATNRKTGGVSYQRLDSAFSRLQGTQFVTNIKTGKKREQRYFSLIESGSGFVYHDDDRMRLDYCEVILSDWIMRAIESTEVVTLSNDYFRIRKPLERRIYEIARKHCGKSPVWKIGLDKLQTKTGSGATIYKFRSNLLKIIQENATPDYKIEYNPKTEMVTFRPRKEPKAVGVYDLIVQSKTHDKARKYAGGWDTYVLEGKWREWLMDSDFIPDSVEGSYIAFVKKYVENNGRA